MMKNTIPWLVIAISSLLIACRTGRSEKQEGQPNIIIFLADDQGWGDLSMNGNPDLATPNIDAMAEDGVVFENFYVCPLCAPTRAEMLTGRYYARTGVSGVSEGRERLNPDETTMADVFRMAGYETGAFGKWHNGTQYPYHPLGRGFTEFYGFTSGHWGNYFSPLLDHNGEMTMGEGYLSDDLTGQAIDFIREHRRSPFFVYLPFNIPHSPMQLPDEDWEEFAGKKLTTEHRYRDREDVDHTRAAYAMCENIDMNVGRVLDALEEMELEEHTIVIYFSDNGPNGWRWNGGMKGKKGHTDEGGVRSPFIIRWSGTLEPGLRLKEIAGAIDMLPTLSELAGIRMQPGKPLDGRSLAPLMLGKSSDWEARYIVSHWQDAVSLRGQNFRLDRDNRLFDMVRDPGQTTDVSGKFPDIYAEMVKHKVQWIRAVLSDLPEKDNRTFPVGHPGFRYHQLPARDGVPHGNIERSNRYPNCTFFTGWTSPDDSITWDVEVLEAGAYRARVFYTCSEPDTGSVVRLSSGSSFVESSVTIAHDPPLEGAVYDRVPRQESYTKEFISMELGRIRLEKGKTTLVLSAEEVAGDEVMDVRLLMLERGWETDSE